MRISNIEIKRFRSINNLKLEISENYNISTICGQNNVGKTNVLRALNIFFRPNEFNYKKDVPEFKQMTGGASVFPLITIDFKNGNDTWKISKDFNPKKIPDDNTSNHLLVGKKNGIKTEQKEIEKELSKLYFFYLPSIN